MLPTVFRLMTVFEFLHIVPAVDDIPIIGFNAKRNQKEFSSYLVLKAGPYKWNLLYYEYVKYKIF